MKLNPVYSESHSFLSGLLVVVLGCVGTLEYWPYFKGEASLEALGFPWHLLVLALVLLLCYVIRLSLRIDEQGIHIRFFPLLWRQKSFLWSDIASASTCRYKPFDFGGWGYRKSGAVTAFTTKGRQGLKVTLNNKQSFLIGIVHPERVQSLVDHYLSNSDES